MMKKPLILNSVLANNQEKFRQLRAIAVVPPRKTVRVRPRRASEALALCRAVVTTVREARQTGRLVKENGGYTFRWSDS